MPFFTPFPLGTLVFFFPLSASDHGGFAEGNMAALHTSSHTMLHVPGRACVFHIWFLCTLVSVDNYIWHSSFLLPKLRLKQRLSCINVVLSVPAHEYCYALFFICALSQFQSRPVGRERSFSGGSDMCACACACILPNA